MVEQTVKCTTEEFATMQGVSYAEANGLLKFLQSRGLCKLVGKQASRSRETHEPVLKGKKRNVWELPIKIDLELVYRPQ